jgi:small ligand-binding sensory domain FIST
MAMRFGSACVLAQDLDQAVGQISDEAESQLHGNRPDLVLVFITSHFEDQSDALVRTLVGRFGSAVVAGCSAEGVIGTNAECERMPALSVLVASLPGAHVHPFRASPQDLARPQEAHGWIRNLLPDDSEGPPSFILLADPFSVPISALLKLFNQSFPGRPVLGGMVSGCEEPEQSVLVLGRDVYRSGAVGLRITGDLEIHTVVSQGCRPVGDRFVITKGQKNVIQQLGGKPALQQLRDLLRQLSGNDLVLAEQSLFVGLAIDERKDKFGGGDFLIRHLLAGDPNSGAIMVGDEIRVGTSVQFHVRDARTADDDLRQRLTAARVPAAGALLFTCNGRGTRMWSKPNHDVTVVNEICGPLAVAGFFAAGEFGPVEGQNFIHGHTASIGLFYEGTRKEEIEEMRK